jgi:PAS domain S-box-containing protein
MTSGVDVLSVIGCNHDDIGTMTNLSPAAPDVPSVMTNAAFAVGLFERLDIPFFLKNADLVYVAVNPAMARLCGVTDPAALVGRRAVDLFPRAEAERFEALDRAVMASGRPLHDRLERVAAGRGRPAWLLYSRVPVCDAAGRLSGIAASARRMDDGEAQAPRFARLSAAVAWLEADLARPFDLVVLAAAAGVSAAQIERDFRAAFSMPPRRFQQKLRIDWACAALIGGAPVAEIALACGFADQSAFTRRFHAIAGCTPSLWRRRHRSLAKPRALG